LCLIFAFFGAIIIPVFIVFLGVIMKLTDDKKVRDFILLLTIMYLVSYVTRINYGAVVSEIVQAEGILKSVASLAVTGSFITYGAGQLISGFMGDKLQPKFLVLAGLIVTVSMNLIISFLSDPYIMTAVWSVNGFAQAFMWPPIVKLMTELLNGNDYKKASVVVSLGASFGTIAVYLFAPLCVAFSGWRAVFVVSAIAGVIMSFIWARHCPVIDMSVVETGAKTEEKTDSVKLGFPFIILAIMPVIAMQGALRDGIQTWMPSFILETFNLQSFAAILTGVVLPIFSIICLRVTSKIYEKKITNEIACAGAILGFGFVNAFLLWLFPNSNVILSTIFAALLSGSMHGVNMILVCMVPPYFKKYGRISFISGLLNSCTYVGSAISTYGIAKFSESFGWNSTILLWACIAFVGALICALITKSWKKFTL